ncbi:hypothetical protein CLV59_11512 [Chitinophaga dinghuensis]|uniref:Uncharacterized protein n=1 Tax=Chitinophaga dinghuensis TaxID=1539050 RepID=A0A327VGU0_9BACT|nr:hypothetical protein CLV59_11512 [Chitinophaga dinghuensis]
MSLLISLALIRYESSIIQGAINVIQMNNCFLLEAVVHFIFIQTSIIIPTYIGRHREKWTCPKLAAKDDNEIKQL